MKKITTILILALSSLWANAQDIQMAPGSVLSVFQLQQGQTSWNQGQEPINSFVDRTQSFDAYKALDMNNDTKSLVNSRYLATAWYGFIEIKEAGVYVFALQDNVNAGQSAARKTSVYINNKPYLVTEIHESGLAAATTSATKTLKLDPGFYKIDLVRAHTSMNALRVLYNSNYPATPTLTYWNKLSPLAKTAITPATLMLRKK